MCELAVSSSLTHQFDLTMAILTSKTVMGWSSDFMPYVGEIPGKPGQHIIAGFSGHGMPQILLSAKGLSEMIKGEKEFEVTGIPRLFKPTRERLVSEKNEILDGLAAFRAAQQPQPKL